MLIAMLVATAAMWLCDTLDVRWKLGDPPAPGDLV